MTRYLLINQNIDATEIHASLNIYSSSTSLKTDFGSITIKRNSFYVPPLALASSHRFLSRRTGGFSITPRRWQSLSLRARDQRKHATKRGKQKLTVDYDDDAQQAEQQVSQQAHLHPSNRDHRKKGGTRKKEILTCCCRTSFFNLAGGESPFLELSLAISRPGTGECSSRS